MVRKIRQEILDRYNATWEDAHVIDNTGLIQICKENFEVLVDQLIEEVAIKNSEINRL